MKIKDGAVLAGISIKMRPALLVADSLWSEYGQELVITEGVGGTHSAGSLHYYGYALDMRTNYFDPDVIQMVYEDLQDKLDQMDDYFQVILHSTHIHVEYDNPEISKWWTF